MKIALIDLNHMSRGVHTNTVPLGLGVISRYLKKSIGYKFDIKIFKDAEKAIETFKSWKPDVLGLAQYVWNSKLNMHVANLVKQKDSGCLIIAGGPNLELSKAKKADFLNKHAFIDICVAYDGEIPFAAIVKRFLKGESIEELRGNPVVGAYSIDLKSGCLIESDEPAPRLDSLDVFGSIYADGIFDEFLDDGFHPFLQTHRGCPFSCSFCHTSDSHYSKVLFQSPKIFREDMEYLGKRFAGQHNVILYLANTNMSLFKEDFNIAKIIREIQSKHDWPAIVSVNSGKDPQKLLDMLSIIEFQPAIALQTLTPHVLRKINRVNIPFGKFVDFQKKVMQKTGKMSATELILSLPGETKESFLRTISTILNSDIQNIVVYTLMNLKGTPISTEKNKRQYGCVVKSRVVPRQFSEINGAKVMETEEVVVATRSMPYEDYLELRGLSFVVKVFFSSAELIPLKKVLREHNADVAQWIFNIHKNLSKFKDIYSNYLDFMKETEDELFAGSESLGEFFNKKENWDALCLGKYGENLLRKYMLNVLYRNYESYLELAVSQAYELVVARCNRDKKEDIDNIFKDIALYLSVRGVKQILEGKRFTEEEQFKLNYNIPQWFEKDKAGGFIEAYKGPCLYSAKLTENSKKWRDNFSGLNRDINLSLQNLYHQGGIDNFWPLWTLRRREVCKS